MMMPIPNPIYSNLVFILSPHAVPGMWCFTAVYVLIFLCKLQQVRWSSWMCSCRLRSIWFKMSVKCRHFRAVFVHKLQLSSTTSWKVFEWWKGRWLLCKQWYSEVVNLVHYKMLGKFAKISAISVECLCLVCSQNLEAVYNWDLWYLVLVWLLF